MVCFPEARDMTHNDQSDGHAPISGMDHPQRILRLVPDKPLPPYAYVPGRLPHPSRDPQGHSFRVPPERLDPPDLRQWRSCRPYLYGLDLFNCGYYWEAHEAWEELWVACDRSGCTADFLKGLIRLAAAGVKVREGKPRGARRHASRAAELFQESALKLGDADPRYMGLRLRDLVRFASDVTDRPITRNTQGPDEIVFDFALRPS